MTVPDDAQRSLWYRLFALVVNWPYVHKRPDPNAVRELWNDDGHKATTDEQRISAHRGIVQRTNHRGRSVASTLVFIGFLVAAQVALLGYGLTSDDPYLRLAVKPTIVALMFIFWGMWPTAGNLAPRWRGDEGVEALRKSDFNWYMEDVGRSSAQRQQLWRLRLAMTISLVATMVTLALLLFA